MNEDVRAERKKLLYEGVIKIVLAFFSFFTLIILSTLVDKLFGNFLSMFLLMASFVALVVFFIQGVGNLEKISLLNKKTQDSFNQKESGENRHIMSASNLNPTMIIVATLSTLIALIVTAIFPFFSISFPLGKEIQLIMTAIAGPVSFFLLKEKRSVGHFFMMHFMLTIGLRMVFEVLLVVLIIRTYGF